MLGCQEFRRSLGRMTARVGQRGRRQLLDEARVVTAALSLLDSEGLAGVSFRRIGAALGVSHMTIYSSFPSKNALLEALVASTLDVPSIHPVPEAPWPDTLKTVARDIYAALSRRPVVAELLVTLPFDGQWIAGARESLLDLLREAGFAEEQARDGLSVVFNYLLGAVLIDARRTRGGSSTSFEQGLRYLVDGLTADLASQRRS